MAIRLSHSGKSTYLVCAHKYKLHYIERWRSATLSSSLLFGQAMDEALNYMLLNKDNKPLKKTLQIFNEFWEQGTNNKRQKVDLPLNPDIKFLKHDWSPDILEKKDWADLFSRVPDYFTFRTALEDKVKAGLDWIDLPEDDRMHYNYGNWLSLQKKGELLLTAFHDQILPQIKRVLAVQMQVELDDGEGNIFNGVIDYVCELHDGQIAVMDNKTTSYAYDEAEGVKISEQLATYYGILNLFNNDPGHPWKHRIDVAGYSVLNKKIEVIKDKTCKSCGHKGGGSHKTCDNTLQKQVKGKMKEVRCNGAWDVIKTFNVNTQFFTGEISEHFAESVLENATTVKSCIEMGLFPKNFSACADQFGSPCPFIKMCHGGNTKGLEKLEKKSE